MRLLIALTTGMTLFMSTFAHADLILSAAPRESNAEGVKTYGALAERLSSELGEKVVYEHPSRWAEYSDKIRSDYYDILMDGPHLVSWRIKHTGFHPVSRLPGHLAFKFVVLKGNKRFNDAKSLQWAKVCAFATPNLTAVALLDHYRNVVTVPTVVPIKGTMRDIFQGLVDKKCDAAVLRDQFYDKKLTPQEKNKLNTVVTTRKFPNQGISTSRRVTQEQREKIAKLLQQGDPSIKPIIDRFAKKAKRFIASNVKEHEEARGLLEGVVWGW